MPGTDLHCHLLPGVDDGPSTMAETLAYATAVVGAGTDTVTATPHVELVDVRELPDRVHEVRAELAREGIALHVECGGELQPGSVGGLDQDELEIIAHGPPGARWLLYEVPFGGVDDAFLAGARELADRGFGLLLAHPERSRGLLYGGGLDALRPLLAAGALVELNVDPLRGGEGPDRQEASREVLGAGLVHVVATDAHAPRRPFTLAMGAEAVTAATGRADLARRYTAEAPARLLAEGVRPLRRAA